MKRMRLLWPVEPSSTTLVWKPPQKETQGPLEGLFSLLELLSHQLDEDVNNTI